MNNILSNYKIVKKLGYGMIGTVYLATKGNKEYALKIEHILKEINMVPIQFCLSISNKYPDHFIKLVDYGIVDNCKHKQVFRYNLDMFPKKVQNKLTKINNSNYCMVQIFTLIDTTLEKIINKLSIKQIYSMILQVIYILHIMHTHNYVHGDFHWGNIGVKKTDKKTVKMFDKNVYTKGYLFLGMDFGEVLYKKNLKSKSDKNLFKECYKYEIPNIKQFLYSSNIWKYIQKNNLNIDFNTSYKKFKKTNEYKLIKSVTSDRYSQMFLFDVLYPNLHKDVLLGNSCNITIKQKLLVPLEDIIFFVKYENDVDKLVNYFLEKLNI